MEKKPNFFIIGAPKCGTTSLAKWLSSHPQIYFSKKKEPHFFNTDENWIWTKSEIKYLNLFKKVQSNHKAIGEGSVWYLNSKVAVTNIEAFTQKKAKYIVCLRNPVEMVVSLHNQFVVSGKEENFDFKEAWDLSELRALGKETTKYCKEPRHLDYKNVCLIGQQVERLLENVNRSRLHFIIIDDLKSNPQQTLQQVLNFLEVQAVIKIPFVKHNGAKKLKSAFFRKAIMNLGIIKEKLGVPISLGLLNRLNEMNKKEYTYRSLDQSMKMELQQYFKDDIQLLENLIGRDLSAWKI